MLKAIFTFNRNINILSYPYFYLGYPKSDCMTGKTYIYEWQEKDIENFTGIERQAFTKADELNDKMLDIKIMIDEIIDDRAE